MPEERPSPLGVTGLEFKAKLLLALIALLIVGSVFYVLYARGLFEPTQRLVLIAENSEGVVVGMDMTFAGFPIGRVSAIELGEDGNARILIDIPRKDARWLRESSVYTLVRGLLGNTNLRAYTGIPTDPPLQDGAEKKVLIGDAADEIPRVTSAARQALERVAALSAADAPLGLALTNLQTVTERLKGPGGALEVLMGNEADVRKIVQAIERSNALLARMDGAVARLDAVLGRTDAVIAKADTQVLGEDGLVRELRNTVVQLHGVLGDVRGTLGKMDAVLTDAQSVAANAKAATTDLDALRREVDANLRRIQYLLDEISRRWPFARDTELKLP